MTSSRLSKKASAEVPNEAPRGATHKFEGKTLHTFGVDRDLDRIARLIEIIRRYELLVEALLLRNDIELFAGMDLDAEIETVRSKYIDLALEQTNGNVSQAGALLGLHRRKIHYYLQTRK